MSRTSEQIVGMAAPQIPEKAEGRGDQVPFETTIQKEYSMDKEKPSAKEDFGSTLDITSDESSCISAEKTQLPPLSNIDESPEYELKNLQIDEVEPPVLPIDTQPSPEIVRPAGDLLEFDPLESSSTSKSSRIHKGNENNRARAEEINAGSKIVPRVELLPQDYFGFEIEIEAWFSMAKEYHNMSMTQFMENEQFDIFDKLFSNLQAPVNVASRTILERMNNAEININQLLQKNDFYSHTFIFIHLCAQIEMNTTSLSEGSRFVCEVINRISQMRWMMGAEEDEYEMPETNEEENIKVDLKDKTYSEGSILSQLLVILRLAILATLGGSNEIKSVRTQMWNFYNLGTPTEDLAEFASPINYSMFMDDIEKRYPAYSHFPDKNQQLGMHLRKMHSDPTAKNDPSNATMLGSLQQKKNTPAEDPASLVSQKSVMPYVPVSIIEACELFRSRVSPTPQMLQLYDEVIGVEDVQERKRDEASIQQVVASKVIYKNTVAIQKSFVAVVMDKIQSYNGQYGGYDIHAALASLCLLLQWFEVSHILMFENLSAILFDYQFHFVVHVFCQNFPKILHSILCDYTCTGSSVFWKPLLGTYDGGPQLKWAEDGIANDLIIKDCNRYHLQTYTHLMTILRLIVIGKAQRIIVVTDMSVEPFKELFNIHETDLWTQILEFFKVIIPYTGKRWRYLNIELISAIYLYCPSKIDDNWLSGVDISNTMRYAPAEEYQLRKLIQEYNSRL